MISTPAVGRRERARRAVDDKRRGFLMVLFASLCLSTVPIVVRFGLESGAAPLRLLAPRMVLGAVLLWVWILATRQHRLRIDRDGLRTNAIAGGINATARAMAAYERASTGETAARSERFSIFSASYTPSNVSPDA